MKKITTITLAGLMCSCTPKALLFTDRTSYGGTVRVDPEKNDYLINVGSDFKSLAVVPMFDENGDVILIDSDGTGGNKYTEAASVFASFQSRANVDPNGGGISMGRIFATGRAAVESAKNLSEGAKDLAAERKLKAQTELKKVELGQ